MYRFLFRRCAPIVIAFMALLLLFPASGKAILYTYTYTGNPLTGTSYDGDIIPYGDGNPRHFSLSFQLEGDLQADHAYNYTVFAGTNVDPATGINAIDFQMSNGVDTFTVSGSEKSQLVIYSLDGNNLPLGWWIELYGPLPSPLIEGSVQERFYSYADEGYQGEMSFQYTYHESGFWLNDGPYFGLAAIATNQYTPGTWSRTAVPSSVPEPGTILLLTSGLIGLAVLRRKNK